MGVLRIRRALVVLTVLATWACSVRCSFASVVVGSGDYTGSRTTVGASGAGGGLIWNPAGGAWSGGKFSIEWNIIETLSDFTYTYTVKTPGALGGTGAQLSHWILELSERDAAGNPLETYWEDVFVTPPTPGNYSDVGIEDIELSEVGATTSSSGNPGMPAGIFGVRFTRNADVNTTNVTFTTPQVPVWGDFYAKDGGGNGTNAIYAYNIGFGTDPLDTPTTVFTNWIPRPDGDRPPVAHTPEPAAIIIWSLLGGLGLVFARRKR